MFSVALVPPYLLQSHHHCSHNYAEKLKPSSLPTPPKTNNMKERDKNHKQRQQHGRHRLLLAEDEVEGRNLLQRHPGEEETQAHEGLLLSFTFD